MLHILHNSVAGANSCSAVESRDHFTNGASSKSQMSRRNQISIFGIILMYILVLYGCSSTQPMTKKIYNQASKVGNIAHFQYYVSRNIILTKAEDEEVEGKVAVSGTLKITSNIDAVQITSSTEGVLLRTETDNNGYTVYYVSFEGDDKKYLRFVQRTRGNEEKIYLVYDRDYDHSVFYGDDYYNVVGEGGLKKNKLRAKTDNFFSKINGTLKGVKSDDNDEPYLLVKMKAKFKEKEKYRKASGRKVEVN